MEELKRVQELRIDESSRRRLIENQDTINELTGRIQELQNEVNQKKLGPDYHRLKTMVKRSIEQEIRNKNFGIRNGNYERNAVVKNQGTKQHVQRILGELLVVEIQRAVF